MKYLVKFFVVTFLLLICTHVSAEQKIAFLNIKFVLNNSKAGSSVQDLLQKSFKENQKKFLDEEETLKGEENSLLGKKTILTKEEYKKLSDDLRKKVIDYQSRRKGSIDKIARQRSEARKKLLDELDPILKNYVKANNIQVVLDKKHVLMGNNELDITDIIVKKLNEALPSLTIK